MLARLYVVLLCLAGCDRLFGLEQVDPPTTTDAAVGDSRSDSSDAAPDAAVQCPAAYDLALTGYPSRYRAGAIYTTWDAAETACALDMPGGTHLVVLDDDGERVALFAELGNRGITGSQWISLNDRQSEGTFVWITAQEASPPPLTTPPWGAGQPDAQSDAQDCVRIQGAADTSPSMLDDSECTSSYLYVCECDGYAPDPTRFRTLSSPSPLRVARP